MGKRKKSTRKPVKVVREKLNTVFTCLFCNHEKSVVCHMDKKLGVGTLSCKVCGQTFQAPVDSLTAPIDIYSEWVDACEAVAQPSAVGGGPPKDAYYNDDFED